MRARLDDPTTSQPVIALPGADDADPARDAWSQVLALVFRDFRFPKVAAEFDLSPMQARMLQEIAREGPAPMSSLAGHLHCDASNVTGIVDRLEARGIIERRPATHDRRVKELHLTAQGRALTGALLESMLTPPPAIRSLPPADQRELAAILRRALGDAGGGSEAGRRPRGRSGPVRPP